MQIVSDIPKIKERPSDGHKGTFGKVCIVGGCLGMSGAVALAGRAALRAGAGLVRVAVPKSILPIVASLDPCYTTIPLAEDSDGVVTNKALPGILKAVEENDAIAVGPGMNVTRGTRAVLDAMLRADGMQMVIDGDGLNNLTMLGDWTSVNRTKLILTPHPGEMKRVWKGLFREPLPEDRKEQAVLLAKASQSIVVLKGEATVVTDGERVYINETGNPGMATGGSGDVLTGVILGLLGQGYPQFDACILGVYLHGLAGDIVAHCIGQESLVATELIEALGEAFLHHQVKDQEGEINE